MFLANIIKHLSVFFLVILLLVVPHTVSAQTEEEGKARLEGTILNEEKEPIPDAKIQMSQEDSDQVFQSQSSELGVFSSSPLSPGQYTLTIEKQGYKSFTSDLELSTGLIRKVTIVLIKEESKKQIEEKEAFQFFERGLELSKENKADDAIQAFQKAVELKPDLAEAYLNLGVLLLQEQKFDETEQALLKFVELNPEGPKAKIILADVNLEQAKVLIREKKMDEALKKLEQSYSFRQDHAVVNYLLGYLYYRNKMKDEAIKHLEAFIQLAPNAPQVEIANKLLKSLKENK